MKKLLSAILVFTCLSANAGGSFEAAQYLGFGYFPGTSNLTQSSSGKLPTNFRKPIYISNCMEMGFRYQFLHNSERTFCMSLSVPLQMGITYTNGPSKSEAHNIVAFSLNVPAYLTANYGLGSTKKAANQSYGLYFSAGASLNRSFVKDREYEFEVEGGGTEKMKYVYPWIPALNVNFGFRFQQKDKDIPTGLGINTVVGKDGMWFAGLTYSAIGNFGR
ncbi:MAG: hypothetical protein ACKOXB_13940 [Flavobacteriales bacterium]